MTAREFTEKEIFDLFELTDEERDAARAARALREEQRRIERANLQALVTWALERTEGVV